MVDVVTVSDRAALSQLASSNLAAYLRESGREGPFVWDSANLSSNVSADIAQGIYVAPSTDTTGASGAWVRKFTGPHHDGWFGAVGDGATDDTTAIQRAIDFVEFVGGGVLRLKPGKVYKVSSLTIDGADVEIDARGATVTSASTSLAATLNLNAARGKVRSGIWKLTAGNNSPWHIDVTGSDCELDGVRMVKTPAAGHYHMYVRHTADGFRSRHCRFEGSNGVYVEASNVLFESPVFIGRASGGDDGVAIKSISDSVRNVRVANGYFENLAAGLSIGSEIGVPGANDSTYSRTVGQIEFSGNRLKNCSGIALIKPGGISEYDYRDGTVEDVVIANNTLEDLAGLKFARGIALTPARGARIRNVRGRNNIIRARSIGGVGRLAGAVDMYIPGQAGGTADVGISDIDLEVYFVDPYQGQSNHASRPGYPVNLIVAAEVGATGTGTFTNIKLAIDGDGCWGPGVFVDETTPADIDEQIEFTRLRIKNANRSAIAANGGADIRAVIKISDPEAVIEPAAGDPIVLGAAGGIIAQTDQAHIGTVAAGPAVTRFLWAAPRRCMVQKVELLSATGIATDATNAASFEAKSSAGTFAGQHTLTAGGAAVVANTLYNLPRHAGLTARSFLSQNELLSLLKDMLGTGRAITDAWLRIHWVPR